VLLVREDRRAARAAVGEEARHHALALAVMGERSTWRRAADLGRFGLGALGGGGAGAGVLHGGPVLHFLVATVDDGTLSPPA
jgi:hypothetical protein